MLKNCLSKVIILVSAATSSVEISVATNHQSNPASNVCKLSNQEQIIAKDFPLPQNPRNLADYLSFEVTNSRLVSRFTPLNQEKQPVAIDQLARSMGYEDFNWVSYVETDPYGINDYRGNLVKVPYSDPPPGGYEYDAADRQPFYWDIEQCQNCHFRHHYQHPLVRNQYSLTFEDSPSDYRLKPGESIDFITNLVGINPQNRNSKASSWDILASFRWQLTNTPQGKSKILLSQSRVNEFSFSPQLRAEIAKDGGIVPKLNIASKSKNNPHSHQCQQQNHQNQDLVGFH